MKTHDVEILILRQEHLSISQALIIRATVTDAIFSTDEDEMHDAFEEELSDGIRQWVRQTKEGRELYEYATSDMNFGDLASHGGTPYLTYCPNILNLEFVQPQISNVLTYDTFVCGEVEEDEYESAS